MKPQPCIEAELKRWGCPYKADDPRAGAWLNGYREGYRAASNMALETIGYEKRV